MKQNQSILYAKIEEETQEQEKKLHGLTLLSMTIATKIVKNFFLLLNECFPINDGWRLWTEKVGQKEKKNLTHLSTRIYLK